MDAKVTTQQSIERTILAHGISTRRIDDRNTAIADIQSQKEYVTMPSKLVGDENQYHQAEGLIVGANFYEVLYEAELHNSRDWDIRIARISYAPMVETKKGDDTYRILRKVERDIYDKLADLADNDYYRFHFDEDMEQLQEQRIDNQLIHE